MTVEIVIMNFEAIALASDSAVTATAGDDTKIFGSQNKLFALSDVAPVGILVYGGAAFMSIPWEVLIKEYRHRNGKTVFPKLHDHVTDFCRFLIEDIGSQISLEHQTAYAESLVALVYRDVVARIRERVSSENESISSAILAGEGESAVQRLINLLDEATAEVVRDYSQRAREAELLEDAPSDILTRIRQSLRVRLPILRREIFGRELKPAIVRMLNTIATRAAGTMVDDVLGRTTGMTTGIVVAGFGREDLFPSFEEVEVEGIVTGVLKKRQGPGDTIGPDNPAMVVSFAQDDMIYQFMQGIAPDYDRYLHFSVVSHFKNYTESLLKMLEPHLQVDRDVLLENLQDLFPKIAESFGNQLKDFGRDEYATEIVGVVAMLPKEQLGELAEALVNLTSLKKRVSLGDETVGGPTDVAIITKGDGLVWVKRKHYFPLN